ncbi:unnamed protein product [Nezara viridula]|uniref:Uncharacterized protein n=1 Tax=Nezara viridula TaxID=85310 RepID=A0A9P0MU18_NEZVI|nr:unnamed protein product [Nezara viridula]
MMEARPLDRTRHPQPGGGPGSPLTYQSEAVTTPRIKEKGCKVSNTVPSRHPANRTNELRRAVMTLRDGVMAVPCNAALFSKGIKAVSQPRILSPSVSKQSEEFVLTHATVSDYSARDYYRAQRGTRWEVVWSAYLIHLVLARCVLGLPRCRRNPDVYLSSGPAYPAGSEGQVTS